MLTSLSEGFVVEARFAHGEGVPFAGDDYFVDVDNIEVLVLENHLLAIRQNPTSAPGFNAPSKAHAQTPPQAPPNAASDPDTYAPSP